MKKFQAVGIMVPLEDGISKEQIVKLLEMLPDDEQLVPFEASENNSTIFGFITIKFADEHLDSVVDLATILCSDWENESTDKTYRTLSGLEVFIDCEYETARGEKELRQFTSWGNYVTVETKTKTYEQVILCPKPNTPAIHLLEASNGDVEEIKTAEIVSINGRAV